MLRPAATLITIFTGTLLNVSFAAGEKFASHPPTRPLPMPSQRPLAAGPARFVDPVKGDDAAGGSEGRPWKSVNRGVKALQPGETLYLRGGICREAVTVACAGTAEKPITIRAYPGELAIFDGGLPEFYDDPAKAWEPCPGGAPGEFWSAKTYPNLGGTAGGTNVLGRFGDSLLPLHGYRFLNDLRSANQYWNLEKKVGEDDQGIYCGPGVFHDVTTGRIHIRLAHTTLAGLRDDNYRGETDPRKLKLIIAGFQSGSPLALHGARYVRIQDLVVRGAREPTVDVAGCANVEFDGLTVYGSTTSFRVQNTAGLRLLHTACRGIAAPWTFRGSLKYRAIEARIFSASSWEPTGHDNRNLELAYSEFTDSVDGVFVGNARGVRFHHNLLDNVSDDGIFLTAGTAWDGTTHGGDVQVYQNLLARCLTTFAFGVGHGRQKTTAAGKQTGSGVLIYRNVFDYRRPVPYHIPASPAGPQEIDSKGRFASDHGSPAWEPMTIYHNTILADDAPRYTYGTWGLGNGIGHGTRRRIFNNIVVQMKEMPGTLFPPPATDFQADANLLWSIAAGPTVQSDPFARFRQSKAFEESKTRYTLGWGAQDRFADPKFTRLDPDWKTVPDLRLQDGSAALDAGMSLPADWPDPLRGADAGKPDLGVLPRGVEPWRVGVRGRLTMFGEARPTAALPTFTPVPFPEPPAPPKFKPAAVVRGYPGFDGPYIQFALTKHGVPVEVFDRTATWLDTKEYGKYAMVVLVGDLARAKLDPNKYSKDDLALVRKYLEDGGTLFLMRVGAQAFATPEGRDFLADLTGGGTPAKATPLQVRLGGHPWVKHLDAAQEHPWVSDRLAVPLRVGSGDAILGNDAGNAASLYQVKVGKGRLIYLGWEISTFLPPEKGATVDRERIFEEQIRILMNIVADVYR